MSEHEAADLALTLLRTLEDDQRMAVFYNFCRSCGSENPSCQCWNDE